MQGLSLGGKPWNRNNNNKRRFMDKKPDNKKAKMKDERKEFPECTTCGKRHDGECYKKLGAFFNCEKTGHQIKDCPSSKEKDNKT